MKTVTGIVLLVLLTSACSHEAEPGVTVGIDGCTSCSMVIDREREAAVYFVAGEQHEFCSPGCLLEGFEGLRHRGGPLPERIYFTDSEGGGFVPAESTTFLISNHLPTVMDWGFRAYADPQAAVAAMQYDDERTVDWMGLRTLGGRPDVTLEITLGPDGLEPEVSSLEKGQLAEWLIHGRDLEGPVTLELRGYPELGTLEVLPAGDPVQARLLATRPGAGFPIVRTDTGEVLGQLRVEGAHTADEEAR